MLSWKVLNWVALFVFCAVIERRHPPLFFLSIQYDTTKVQIFVPQTSDLPYRYFFCMAHYSGSHYSWMCAHPVGTHRMFYASVKARIDWHSVNSGFACMSFLVTLLGHRFLFERDTLLSLFMFAILVRSYSLQYNQHKCVKISLLNLLHSKVWIHADPQQTVFPRTTALPLVFQCNFGGLDKMSKCKVIMIYVKDSVTSLPILRLIKSSTRVSVKFVQDGSCRDIW